jgi:two-component system alkaline phosphatase synthesis response regulator PhoP
VTTILVVDDEPTLLAVVAEILREEGYAVVAVSGARAALVAFGEALPDLVLMDVMMPGMDGRAAFLAMRAHADGEHVPIVLTSAAADPSRLPPSITAFLRKPYDLEALLVLVARLAGPP